MKRSIQLPTFTPARKSSCLCGSGRRFKQCCFDQLSDKSRARSVSDLMRDGKCKEALQAQRAELTAYSILYKSHTEPMVRAGMPTKGSLYEVDMNAFFELIDTLLWCYRQCDIAAEFPATLERLRPNVIGEPWQRRIQYFHTMYALSPEWNEDAGRREFEKLGFPTEEDSIEMMQLHLDLFADELSFSQKMDLVDSIVGRSKKLSDRLHYIGARACFYFLIGDDKRACDELSAVIDEVSSKYVESNLDTYERYRLAAAIELLGMTRRDEGLLKDARSRYELLLKDEDLTDRGRLDLWTLIADTCRYRSDWKAAKEAYEEALKFGLSSVCNIFLAECLLHLDKPNEARETLARLEYGTLDQAAKLDYALVAGALAVGSGVTAHLNNAKALLEALDIKDPYFRDRQSAMLLSIQEALTAGTSRPLFDRTKRALAGLAGSLTSYLILKPSFMGVGVDVGKILEDSAKRRSPKI